MLSILTHPGRNYLQVGLIEVRGSWETGILKGKRTMKLAWISEKRMEKSAPKVSVDMGHHCSL